MSRSTWLVLWIAAALVLVAMIELRPTVGLSVALVLVWTYHTTKIARLWFRGEK